MKQLAIIIPAYKATFLAAALDSIAAQTCRNFRLYVGDDGSPYPIKEVVDAYRDKMDVVYRRFDTNLGGTDLVAQWERCIAMSHEEPYIWLFSDDDVMEPQCVERLLEQMESTRNAYDVYHFDVAEIDGEGRVTRLLPQYPQAISAYDYYKAKTQGRLRSYVVENVFSRKIYEEQGGFKHFDLAWGSDVATWCRFAGEKGICRVDGAKVCWRRSGENITPDKSRAVSERKLRAECELLTWAYGHFSAEKDIWTVNRSVFVSKMQQYKGRVGRRCLLRAFQSFFQSHGHGGAKLAVALLIALPKRICGRITGVSMKLRNNPR